PIQSRLIGRVDSGWTVQILRLVAERIRHPHFPIVGSLEFNLEPSTRHDRKEPITICDSKRLQKYDRSFGQRRLSEHEKHLRRGHVRNPAQENSAQSAFCKAPPSQRISRGFKICLSTPHRSPPVKQSAHPSRGTYIPEVLIIQQQHTHREYKVVQKRIVRSQNDPYLPESHNVETRNPPAARKKHHPYQPQFQGECRVDSSRVK